MNKEPAFMRRWIQTGLGVASASAVLAACTTPQQIETSSGPTPPAKPSICSFDVLSSPKEIRNNTIIIGGVALKNGAAVSQFSVYWNSSPEVSVAGDTTVSSNGQTSHQYGPSSSVETVHKPLVTIEQNGTPETCDPALAVHVYKYRSTTIERSA